MLRIVVIASMIIVGVAGALLVQGFSAAQEIQETSSYEATKDAIKEVMTSVVKDKLKLFKNDVVLFIQSDGTVIGYDPELDQICPEYPGENVPRPNKLISVHQGSCYYCVGNQCFSC